MVGVFGNRVRPLLCHKIKGGAILLSASFDDGEHRFDKPAPFVTPRSEGKFAPDDKVAQRPFGSVDEMVVTRYPVRAQESWRRLIPIGSNEQIKSRICEAIHMLTRRG